MKISGQMVLVALILIITISTLASECAGAWAARPPAEATPAAGVFQVTDAEGHITNFTRDKLHSLTLTTLWIGGKLEEGPALYAILNQAGIDDFEQVTLMGVNGSITLMQDQVDADMILDVSNHGTAKLVSPVLPEELWIEGITVIKVR